MLISIFDPPYLTLSHEGGSYFHMFITLFHEKSSGHGPSARSAREGCEFSSRSLVKIPAYSLAWCVMYVSSPRANHLGRERADCSDREVGPKEFTIR